MSKAVGLLIKDARLKVRLSQQALADRLDISPQAISWLEQGHHDPSARTLAVLEGEFGQQLVRDILTQIRREVRT